MTDADDPKRCSRCGVECFGHSSPLGLCPACLLALGMSGIQDSGVGNQESAEIAKPESTIDSQESKNQTLAHARRHRWLAILLASLAIAVVASLFFLMRRPDRGAPPLTRVIRFTLAFPNETESLDGAQFAVSPDGAAIALAARGPDRQSHLYLRRLDALDWRELPRTDDASLPFWSPDSRHLGFFADRRLRRFDVGNGLTQTVCDAPNARGGTWGPREVIVFANSATRTLSRVSASGGMPTPITTLDQGHHELAHVWPRFLADGQHVVFLATVAGSSNDGINAALSVADLESGKRTQIAASAGAAMAADDIVLFLRDRMLVAQRVNAAGTASADVRAIGGADEVRGSATSGPTFSASPGVLVYRSGSARVGRLTWLDREGRAIGAVGDPADYDGLSLSPDGRHVVVARQDDREARTNLWLIDLARGSSLRLTYGPTRDRAPVWSPDATRIAFSSLRGAEVLLTTPVSGGGKEDQIAPSAQLLRPSDWSRDGRMLLYTTEDVKTGSDVWALQVDADRRASPVVQTPANDSDAHFSPDGRWVAYVSNESGRDEVYVRSFPQPDGRWLISTQGGTHPRWRADGRELMFVSADGMLMGAPIDSRSEFRVGQARPLFSLRRSSEFAMSPDGQRFLVDTPLQEADSNRLQVVINWRMELR